MLANVAGGINLHNDNGDTPLLLAARLSQPNVARILLERGKIIVFLNLYISLTLAFLVL